MYFKKGDYQKAVDDFNEVVRLKPSNPISLYKRGEAYEHLGELDKARSDFRAALVIAPAFREAQEGLKRLGKN